MPEEEIIKVRLIGLLWVFRGVDGCLEYREPKFLNVYMVLRVGIRGYIRVYWLGEILQGTRLGLK